MKNPWKTTRYLIILGLLVAVILTILLLYELYEIKRQQEILAINAAKAHVATVISVREWGARQEAVYVTVSNIVTPNPYLKDTFRDVEIEGYKLTKINPAYLTRLLGEVTAENDGVKFHLTSLMPINPNNAPDAWEREALESFEAGQKEKWAIANIDGKEQMRFMEPLLVTDHCLKCHWEQGYLLGQIKGGISVNFSYEPYKFAQREQIKAMSFRFLIFGMILVFFTAGFARKAYLYECEKVGYSKKLEHLSRMDGLTEVLNRRALLEKLDEEIEMAVCNHRSLAVILFDLDDFKLINDNYGHLAGDLVLKNIAQLIKENLRTIDTVGRYGGDEIMVLLPGLTKDKAEIVKTRIETAVANKIFKFEGHQIRQNVSSGVAELTVDAGRENGKMLRDLLIQASDNQLYIDKKLK